MASFASLTADLLTRHGAGRAVAESTWRKPSEGIALPVELADPKVASMIWPPAGLTPATVAVMPIARRTAVRTPRRPPKADPALAEAAFAGPHKVRRVALRLDPQRFVRLKLMSAYRRQPSQQILLEALDRYLAAECNTACVPDSCACLKQVTADEGSR